MKNISKSKVAIIGNMNNNGFSIMRYLRDIGVNAHLFPYSDDGVGPLDHFAPDADTWHIEKWIPYIHPTEITDTIFSIIPNYKKVTLPPSKSYLRSVFNGFDYLIGSGIAPALLLRINRHLDIYYPYSTGVEFLNTIPMQNLMKNASIRGKLANLYVKKKQAIGIKKARFCLSADISQTKQTFKKIGVDFLPYAAPMVYNREPIDEVTLSPTIKEALRIIRNSDLSVISHARLMWVSRKGYSKEDWSIYSKHNDWLIKEFSKFLKISNCQNPLLILLEFGSDVEETKMLINELDASNNVLWLPTLDRKEIMLLLNACSIGVGEFHSGSLFWGGTGWEVLAAGKPLLQSYKYTEDEFEIIYGYPPPPMLAVGTPDDILNHLIDMAEHPTKRDEMGRAAAQWFNKFNGIGLAEKWLNLLA
ncbi:hypothetical protein ACFLSI_03570 [Bacteroidota bacterium]